MKNSRETAHQEKQMLKLRKKDLFERIELHFDKIRQSLQKEIKEAREAGEKAEAELQ